MTRFLSRIELDEHIKDIISEEINIDKKYFSAYVKKDCLFKDTLRLNLIFKNFDKNRGHLLNFKNIPVSIRDNYLFFNLTEKINLDYNYSLIDCIKDTEVIEDLFDNLLVPFSNKPDVYTVVRNFTNLSNNSIKFEEDKDIRHYKDYDYKYKKEVKIAFNKNIKDSIYNRVIKHLLNNYFEEKKSFYININGLDYFAEAFIKSNSQILIEDNITVLSFSDDFKKFLNFKDIKEFQNVKKILMMNFHC